MASTNPPPVYSDPQHVLIQKIELKVAILLTIATVFSSAFLTDMKIAYLSDTPTGYRQTIVIGVEGAMVLVAFAITIFISHHCFSRNLIVHKMASRRLTLGAITFVPAIAIAFILDDVSRVYSSDSDYSTNDIILLSVEAAVVVLGFLVLWQYTRFREGYMRADATDSWARHHSDPWSQDS